MAGWCDQCSRPDRRRYIYHINKCPKIGFFFHDFKMWLAVDPATGPSIDSYILIDKLKHQILNGFNRENY